MQLHRKKEQFEGLGIKIILVGMGTPKQAEVFRKNHSLSFIIICDPRKILYKAYGLIEGGIAGIVSPKTIIRGLAAVGRGHMPGLPSGDIFQLSGIFIIDRNMVIRYVHYSKDMSDNPPIDEIIRQASALI
ncbi:MAG: redoxin domain-containing protein [Nitrospirae bacterium]|nr:redoxin domain-containing protein [Nitrospirota bacterium]MBF0542481.1 redoxin domain-containing protein [Nitrospirota bacterium]